MTALPTNLCPLLAAGFDWFEALLPFLFVAFWIISQVFALFRRAQGGGQRPQPPVRIDRPRAGPRPAGEGGDVRSELERQIEEFLRQSRGEQPRRPEAAAPAPRRSPEPRPDRGRPQPVAKPAAAPAARDTKPAALRPAVAAAPPPAQPQPTQGGTVARHVQDAFSHDLAHSRGGLSHEVTDTETAKPRTGGLAAELAEMLRDPTATRRAILLRDVLDRPVDRW